MSEIVMSTVEMRKADKEFKRDRDARIKWRLGSRPKAGHCGEFWFDRIPEGRRERPIKPESAKVKSAIKRGGFHGKIARNKSAAIRSEIENEIQSASDASNDDVKDTNLAPDSDSDVYYSFDRPFGPRKGSHILSAAVAQAVERYEQRQTDKLIKDEYEVVPKMVEVENAGYVADDDDYEFV